MFCLTSVSYLCMPQTNQTLDELYIMHLTNNMRLTSKCAEQYVPTVLTIGINISS